MDRYTKFELEQIRREIVRTRHAMYFLPIIWAVVWAAIVIALLLLPFTWEWVTSIGERSLTPSG